MDSKKCCLIGLVAVLIVLCIAAYAKRSPRRKHLLRSGDEYDSSVLMIVEEEDDEEEVMGGGAQMWPIGKKKKITVAPKKQRTGIIVAHPASAQHSAVPTQHVVITAAQKKKPSTATASASHIERFSAPMDYAAYASTKHGLAQRKDRKLDRDWVDGDDRIDTLLPKSLEDLAMGRRGSDLRDITNCRPNRCADDICRQTASYVDEKSTAPTMDSLFGCVCTPGHCECDDTASMHRLSSSATNKQDDLKKDQRKQRSTDRRHRVSGARHDSDDDDDAKHIARAKADCTYCRGTGWQYNPEWDRKAECDCWKY